MFEIGVGPKEVLFRLLNPINLNISELYLEKYLWLPLICAEKASHGRVDIWNYLKTYTFNIFGYCNFFGIFMIFLYIIITITLCISNIIIITTNIIILAIIADILVIIYQYHWLLLLVYWHRYYSYHFIVFIMLTIIIVIIIFIIINIIIILIHVAISYH